MNTEKFYIKCQYCKKLVHIEEINVVENGGFHKYKLLCDECIKEFNGDKNDTMPKM